MKRSAWFELEMSWMFMSWNMQRGSAPFGSAVKQTGKGNMTAGTQDCMRLHSGLLTYLKVWKAGEKVKKKQHKLISQELHTSESCSA